MELVAVRYIFSECSNNIFSSDQSSQSIWSRPSTPTTMPASNVQGNAGSTSYIEVRA